jgi:hypothetical protein
LIDAFQLANDLIKSGIDEASFDEKLGFCSLAISGITAFIAEHGASKTDRANELFTLDIEELAYINEVIAEEMDVMSEAVNVKEPTVMLDARSA